MQIGTMVELGQDIGARFARLRKMGMESCQIVCWDESKFTDELAQKVCEAAAEKQVAVTALWCGWGGPLEWNFYGGQATLGLVPSAWRFQRVQTLCRGADFAKAIGAPALVTHVGFLPENPLDSNYHDVIAALKYIVGKCAQNGLCFLFETGQETPVTLRRAMEDIGMDNVGVNLDPANLLMYGKANPVDALDVLGKYVRGVHGKDGVSPADGRHLGDEKPMGQGKVNYPAFIAKLKEVGYTGDITIEREISGEEQEKDILAAKKMLEQLISG